MISPQGNAVYNSPIAEMLIPSPACSSRSCSLLIVLCFCWTAASYATDWTAPARELARKIAVVTGPAAVAINLVNRSSLAKEDMDQIDRDLRLQLEPVGVHAVRPEQAAMDLEISFSENLQNYVWVAEIHRSTGSLSVVLVSTPRSDSATIAGEPAAMTIRKTPVWSQAERILDLVVLEESAIPLRLAVLNPESVTLYKLANGTWQQEQLLSITHSKTWPRDLRGRLILRQGHFLDVYLPGVFCQTSVSPSMNLACRDSDDPWPLSAQFALGGFFTPSRNFFTGVLVPGVGKQTSIAKFYSAAPLPMPGQTSVLWLFAMTDGTLHLLDGGADQTLRVNWGSDLVALKTTCGSGWQILATRPGNQAGDAIRAYEVPDRDPVSVSPAVDFTGAVAALWSDDKGTAAIAVTRNEETETYEAFRLAVACGGR
jgi:hypothetical protein